MDVGDDLGRAGDPHPAGMPGRLAQSHQQIVGADLDFNYRDVHGLGHGLRRKTPGHDHPGAPGGMLPGFEDARLQRSVVEKPALQTLFPGRFPGQFGHFRIGRQQHFVAAHVAVPRFGREGRSGPDPPAGLPARLNGVTRISLRESITPGRSHVHMPPRARDDLGTRQAPDR